MCRRFEKVAKYRFKVPPLAKTSIAASCKVQMAGCLKKLTSMVSWRDTEVFSDYAQSVIQNTTYKTSTTRTNETSVLGC